MLEKGYAQQSMLQLLCLSLAVRACVCVYRNLLSFATKESVFFA